MRTWLEERTTQERIMLALGLMVVFALYGRGRGLEPQRLFRGKLITARGIIGALSIVAFYVTIVKLGPAAFKKSEAVAISVPV